MKRLILCIILFTSILGCSKKDPEPETLEAVLGDKDLAEYLEGKWNYSILGAGMSYYTETMSFDLKTNNVSLSTASNTYETLSNPKFLSFRYTVSGSGDVITLKSSSGLTKYYRIEKKSQNSMLLYERSTPKSRTESDARFYSKIR